MLGEHGKYLNDCLEGEFIGINFMPDVDLSQLSGIEESKWRAQMIDAFLSIYPDKSVGAARTSVGFMWTVCRGLKEGDVVLASNGQGAYNIGQIAGEYYYAPGEVLPHRRRVVWLDKVLNRKDMSKALQNSSGSIGTCCNITKYAGELNNLIFGSPESTIIQPPAAAAKKYQERDLHRLLANYLLGEGILSKTIFHEKSCKKDPTKWVHPDMIGVRFNEFQEPATRTLLKAADTKQYLDFYSYELKRSIDNDHELKEYFFQALSNSSWANYGYLVAFEINDDLFEEMERLNRAFGIGIIRLSPYDNTTQILFQARKNDVDYFTVDKLCKLNPDFKHFMTRTGRVLTAHADVLEDVKRGLESICDSGFANDEEILAYCIDNNIPLSN